MPGIKNSKVVGIEELYRKLKDDLDLMEPGVMRGMARLSYVIPIGSPSTRKWYPHPRQIRKRRMAQL